MSKALWHQSSTLCWICVLKFSDLISCCQRSFSSSLMTSAWRKTLVQEHRQPTSVVSWREWSSSTQFKKMRRQQWQPSWTRSSLWICRWQMICCASRTHASSILSGKQFTVLRLKIWTNFASLFSRSHWLCSAKVSSNTVASLRSACAHRNVISSQLNASNSNVITSSCSSFCLRLSMPAMPWSN